MEGLDQFADKIDNLTKKFEKASKDPILVNFDELFSTSFMKKYTSYNSISSFLKDIGVKNQTEFENLPETILDKHVVQNTKFSSWQAMLNKAGEEYISKFLTL